MQSIFHFGKAGQKKIAESFVHGSDRKLFFLGKLFLCSHRRAARFTKLGNLSLFIFCELVYSGRLGCVVLTPKFEQHGSSST
jgi:hypothetical protein